MEPVGEHPVPAGPLAARWLGYELEPPQAGTLTRARVVLENAGSARVARPEDLSYHWLDERGNPIIWDGLRTRVERRPGERVEKDIELAAPIPPGRYRLAFDLVDEQRFWLAELGNFTPRGRDRRRAARRHVGARPSSTGCQPRPRLGGARLRGARRGLCRRRRLDRDPASVVGARAVRVGRRPQSRLRPPARAAVAARAARAEHARLPDYRRGSRRATSPGSTTRGSGSDFDCDLVVDAIEDERSERERDDRRNAQCRSCRQ